ncbi:MAG: CBS domain-containing protein [Chloroflexi bacterium]|nr:CBS domain-containing protein [Chloroflexota bacterium]
MVAREITRAQKLEFRVGQVMTREVVAVTPSTSLLELKEIMRKRRISGVPVVDDNGDLVGVISLEDLLRAFEQGTLNATVGERMSTTLITIRETDSVDAAVAKFQQTGVGRLPVLNSWGQLVGVLTKGDVTRGLVHEVQAETQDEEIARYRASHIFRDVESDDTSLVLRYKVAPRDFTHGGNASSRIKRALMRLGADPQIVRRAAIASYEAEMNLIIHADHGGVITAEVDASQLKMMFKDDGPGIADLRRALEEEGYTTTPPEIRQMGFGGGMGLKNIRKCADQMHLDSKVGLGTQLEITILLHTWEPSTPVENVSPRKASRESA